MVSSSVGTVTDLLMGSMVTKQDAYEYLAWKKKQEIAMNAADRLLQRERESAERQFRTSDVAEAALLKPAENVFLTGLAAVLRAESEAEWSKEFARDTDRWYTFKQAAALVEANMGRPVFEVLAQLQAESRRLIKLYGKNYGHGLASVEVSAIVKEYAGG